MEANTCLECKKSGVQLQRRLCINCYKKHMRKGTLHLFPKVSKYLTYHRLYRTFCQIKTRCYNPNSKDWMWYGGKGIVCEWTSFEDFLQDMESTWAEGLELDRIDSNKNYCKENCQWITHTDNVRKSSHVRLSQEEVARIKNLSEEGFTQTHIAKIYGTSQGHISNILLGRAWNASK